MASSTAIRPSGQSTTFACTLTSLLLAPRRPGRLGHRGGCRARPVQLALEAALPAPARHPGDDDHGADGTAHVDEPGDPEHPTSGPVGDPERERDAEQRDG